MTHVLTAHDISLTLDPLRSVVLLDSEARALLSSSRYPQVEEEPAKLALAVHGIYKGMFPAAPLCVFVIVRSSGDVHGIICSQNHRLSVFIPTMIAKGTTPMLYRSEVERYCRKLTYFLRKKIACVSDGALREQLHRLRHKAASYCETVRSGENNRQAVSYDVSSPTSIKIRAVDAESFESESLAQPPVSVDQDAADTVSIVDGLLRDHDERRAPLTGYYGSNALPSRRNVHRIVRRVLGVILPGYFGQRPTSPTFREVLHHSVTQIREELAKEIGRAQRHRCPEFSDDSMRGWGTRTALRLLALLPQIRDVTNEDVRAALAGDPAVCDHHEIVAAYPGISAVAIHRVAHELYTMDVPLIPRMMSEYAHSRYAIDIHPGATIAEAFFIDHGTGVVIGQTARIGKNVTLYQGVTIGSLNFKRDANGNIVRGEKRHPTLEDNVTVYANASILGGNTIVGHHSTIAANVRLIHSVAPESLVTMDVGRTVVRAKKNQKKSASNDIGQENAWVI